MTTSVKYCKGHGHQALLGYDMQAVAKDCDVCVVVDRDSIDSGASDG